MSVPRNREAEVARMRGTYAALVEVATGCRIGTPEHTSACKRLRQPERLTERDVQWSPKLRSRGLVLEVRDRLLGVYTTGITGEPRHVRRERALARLRSCRQRLNALEGRPVNKAEMERAERWLERNPERRGALERLREDRREAVRRTQERVRQALAERQKVRERAERQRLFQRGQERLRQVIAERQRMRERAQERTRTPQRTKARTATPMVR